MKSKIMALALFTATAIAVIFYPQYQTSRAATSAQNQMVPIDQPVENIINNEHPRVEVAFVLDTTGSMGGLIQAAKEKIWSIASNLASAQQAPDIRMGLVAYRDRGDSYVTRVIDLSEDLDSVYAKLMDFQAQGGGDGPESVNLALHEAVHQLSWSQDTQTYRVIFLVGDAPPHMDYANDVPYPQTLALAAEKGIAVNTIQCGQNPRTTPAWERIAQLGQGRYFQVEQTGSAVTIATPFDKQLAELSAKLDETRLYYGSDEEKAVQQRKVDASEKLHASASVESRARRAAFNSSKSGQANLLGKHELVDDVTSGRVDLSSIEPEALPEPMQAMSPEAQKTLIQQQAERRNELRQEIQDLAEQRADYLKQKVEEEGGATDSLDHKIYRAVREQAETKGLSYEAGALAY
ncbi:MAG: VWA domain-containing protein [Chromatiales bacterium]|jgi:Mg-chelatase subunit ChlD